MFSLRPIFILFYLSFVVLATALKSVNVTISHDDPTIIWSEGWDEVVIDEQCTHRLAAHNDLAYALVKFNGTALYMISPKWSYHVAATISVDGGSPIHLDLQDHGNQSTQLGPTIPADVVAYQGGLDPDVEHTVRIFSQPGEPFLVFHSLIYTTMAEEPDYPPVATPPATVNPEAPVAGISSRMAMTIGIGIGVGGTLILALAILLLKARRKRLPFPHHRSDSASIFSTPFSPKSLSHDRHLSSPWELPTHVQHPVPSRMHTPRTPSFRVSTEGLPPQMEAAYCPVWEMNKSTELLPNSVPYYGSTNKLVIETPPAYGIHLQKPSMDSPAPRYSTLPFSQSRPKSTAKAGGPLVLACQRRISTDSL